MRGIVRRLHRRHPQWPTVADAVREALNSTTLDSTMSLERIMCYHRAIDTGAEQTVGVTQRWIKKKSCEQYLANSAEGV